MKTLKPIILGIALTLCLSIALAQTPDETAIRKLDNLERDALVKKDTCALFNKYWSPSILVNTPGNFVVAVETTKAMLKAGKIDYSFFDQ